MHIKDNLLNYLYDKEYFINIYENNVYVFNYQKIDLMTDTKIIIKFDKKILTIQGFNLLISKMLKKELLIKGTFNNIGLKYE